MFAVLVNRRASPDRWFTSSTDTTRYVTDPDGSALSLASGSSLVVSHLHTDGQGNTTLLTDGVGARVCTANYNAWGSPDPQHVGVTGCSASNTANTIWYRGTRRDTTTDHYQLGSRTCDPSTATWLTPDSAAVAGPPTGSHRARFPSWRPVMWCR